ncbi:MAG: hypothetical protein WB439_00320 [Acidobacteriaceae bacterium]
MTRWKRVVISFAAAFIAELLIGVALGIADGRALFFEHVFGFVYFASFFVVPGWLIALPIIVIPKNAALPVWQLALIGTAVGPGLMLAIGICIGLANGGNFNYDHTTYDGVGIAALVAGLTTALYPTALKLCSRPTPTPIS